MTQQLTYSQLDGKAKQVAYRKGMAKWQLQNNISVNAPSQKYINTNTSSPGFGAQIAEWVESSHTHIQLNTSEVLREEMEAFLWVFLNEELVCPVYTFCYYMDTVLNGRQYVIKKSFAYLYLFKFRGRVLGHCGDRL